MITNTAETATTSTVAGSATNDASVDSDLFAQTLESKITDSSNAAVRERAAKVLEKLSQGLSGVTVAMKSFSLSASVGTGSTQVTIDPDMLEQMADDEDLLTRTRDALAGLLTASRQQNLSNVSGAATTRFISVETTQIRYVETQRASNGTQLSATSLALEHQKMVSDVIDSLLSYLNGSGSKSSSRNNNSSSSFSSLFGQSSSSKNNNSANGYSSILGNSSSWRLQGFVSLQAATQASVQNMAAQYGFSASASMSASQFSGTSSSFTSLEVTIQQLSASGSLSGASGMDIWAIIQMNGLCDPLVFDLGDEGINLGSPEDGVYFDIKGDGSPMNVSWIKGNNAFLYLDQNGNGLADDGNELFGDAGGYKNGWEKLAQYDDNGDGVIDANDKIYNELRLWRDLNGDGVNQAEESLTLADAGITSINLRHDSSSAFDQYGNLLADRSTFTRADGSQGQVAEAWLKTN